MHKDSSVVEVNVKLAHDQHSSISSSLQMSKGMIGSAKYTVKHVKNTPVDRADMHEDFSENVFSKNTFKNIFKIIFSASIFSRNIIFAKISSRSAFTDQVLSH